MNFTLFSQIISAMNGQVAFGKIVGKHSGDKHCKGYNSWTHLVLMLFSQFANCKSLRDISNGMRSASGNLNHLGVNTAPSKSAISYQNQNRPSEIFREFYFYLLNHLGQQPKISKSKFKIKSKIFALDSTTISLCLSIFDWAKYKTSKGAIKIHTLLEYEGKLPAYFLITDGKTADNKAAFQIPLEKNSVVVCDRFYNDFKLINVWDSNNIFFVIRHKHNLQFESIKERPLPEDRHQNILKDEEIVLKNKDSRNTYPKKLRRVAVWDDENKQAIELITNNFAWTANTIGELYKSRWNVEIFFRDLKQNLQVKTFIGTSENAVRIQIYCALITILLLKYLKAISKFHNWYLSNLVAFIRLNIFVKIDLHYWLNNPFIKARSPPTTNEILLFQNT